MVTGQQIPPSKNPTTAPSTPPLEELSERDSRKKYASWTSGAQVPLAAEIDVLKDSQLARTLAHHRFVVHMPHNWWPLDMQAPKGAMLMAEKA